MVKTSKIGQHLIKLLNKKYNKMEEERNVFGVTISDKDSSKCKIEISKRINTRERISFEFVWDTSYNEFDEVSIQHHIIHGLQEQIRNQCKVDFSNITKYEYKEINFILSLIHDRYFDIIRKIKKIRNNRDIEKILADMEYIEW